MHAGEMYIAVGTQKIIFSKNLGSDVFQTLFVYYNDYMIL